MAEYSRHQKEIISRYYDRREQIMLDRLSEIVSDLYLADSTRRTDQLWKRAEKAMQTLKVPASIATHILTQKQPDLLARSLRAWLNRPPGEEEKRND